MQIDTAVAQLPALRNFIMPGGTELAARLHLGHPHHLPPRGRRFARCLCNGSCPVSGILVTYFNRLSDWLFIQARRANQLAGVEDVLWKNV